MKKTKETRINLEVLKKGQSAPRRGDIFVIKPKGREYYFGLVVNPLVKHITLMGQVSDNLDGALTYIFDQHSSKKDAIPKLDLTKLLLPPLILDLYCWGLGYVENVGSVELCPQLLLAQHCFHDVVAKRYLNEHGDLLSERVEPCGIYGLTTFGGLDRKMGRALGIPPAPA